MLNTVRYSLLQAEESSGAGAGRSRRAGLSKTTSASMSSSMSSLSSSSPSSSSFPSHYGTGASSVTLYSACLGLLFAGAIFGFFYAWVCSAMPGLDVADPRVAIAAMQAVNSQVRNAVFFPAFFLTPLALLLPAYLSWREGFTRSVKLFAAGAAVYLAGGLILTMVVHVPMNEALATVVVPESIDKAHDIWNDYTGRWQFWNVARTVFSGLSLLLGGLGLGHLHR